MVVNSTTASDVNVLHFPVDQKNEAAKQQYTQAIQLWCATRNIAESLTREEIGELPAFARIDLLRKSLVINLSHYYRTHPRADVAPGVLAVITTLADNERGVANVSQEALAQLFARSRHAIYDAQRRLKDADTMTTTRGRYAGATPVIPRAIAASYNHLTWSIEAMRQADVNCYAGRSNCQLLRETSQLKSQLLREASQLEDFNCEVEPVQLLRGTSHESTKESTLTIESLNTLVAPTKTKIAGVAIMAATSGMINAAAAALSPAEPLIQDTQHLAAHEISKGTRLSETWFLLREWGQWAVHNCKRDENWVRMEAAKFKAYWLSVPDSKGRHKSWKRTWQKWCENALKREAKYNAGQPFKAKAGWIPPEERERQLREALYDDRGA